MNKPALYAYYFPGYSQLRRVDEWEIVRNAARRFREHSQPKRPSRYDYIEDQETIARAVELGKDYGLTGFTFLLYWDHGKLEHSAALDNFCELYADDPKFHFRIMWVNRRLHESYPVTNGGQSQRYTPSCDRRVKTSIEDYSALLTHLSEKYFALRNYHRIDGKPSLQIYDSKEFVLWTNKLSSDECFKIRQINNRVSMIATLADMKFRPWMSDLSSSFDYSTNYVLLPDFSGEVIQEYRNCCKNAQAFWRMAPVFTGKPYIPTVTTGWDATPRGVADEKISFDYPANYPDSPIVVGSNPESFRWHLRAAVKEANRNGIPFINISSFNEWSEGHALEPDESNEFEYLTAIRELSPARN